TEWTRDGILRHPSFRGLRFDRDPKEVVREMPRKVNAAARAAENTAKQAKGRSASSAPAARAAAKPRRPHTVALSKFRLTHPDRVLFPEQGLTKEGLAEYYLAVADRMLPHIAGRALTLVRCPDGRGKPCFYQRHPSEGMPEGIREQPIRESDGVFKSISIDGLDGLIGLVQIGALEIHTWGSRLDKPEQPDRIVFDLDPDEGLPWPAVVAAAKEVRQRLAELGLKSFLKTTGGKGLHVVAPIRRGPDWDEIKAFTKAVVEQLAGDAPDRYTANMSKAKRRGRIYVDFLRNQHGATFIAPYSTRAKPGAPVSTPLFWEELDQGVRSNQFNTANLPARLSAL